LSSRISEALPGHEILRRYDRDDSFLVFPSQVVARSWTRRIAGERGVCVSSRLISWDEFKERTFFGKEERRPANSLARSLFVGNLLERNVAGPFLRSLVPPAYADRGPLYKASIIAYLPLLKRLTDEGEEKLADCLGRLHAEDILTLRREYAGFLHRYRRYEPAWLDTGFIPDGAKYCIVFPELLEDFSEYREQLRAAEDVDILSLDLLRDRAPAPILREFRDYRQELLTVLADIVGDLRSGIPPDEIAVTLAGYDSLLPRLMYFARVAGIPLLPRKGRTLLEYSSVSWLNDLEELYRSDFSFASLRRLLNNPGLPWKDVAVPRSVISAGIRHNLMEGGRRRWEKLTEKLPGAKALLTSLAAIRDAEEPADLYSRVYAFLGRYVDTDSWDADDEMAWQRSADTLREMADQVADYPGLACRPFPLALELLGASRYIPQAREPAVAVYDYRVAAGIAVRRHYCVNFSAETTAVGSPASRLFREDQSRALLGEPPALDEAFLSAYPVSGIHVSLSFSRRVRGSSTLPSAPFLGETDVPAPDGIPALWSEPDGQAGSFPAPWEKRGLRLDRSVWEPRPSDGLMARLGISGESITVSRLERFADCRFAYLWDGLGLEEQPTQPDDRVHREVGIEFHRFMEELFRNIAEQDGGFQSGNLESYLAIADARGRREFGFRREGSWARVPEIIRRQLAPRFASAAANILRHIADWGGRFDIEIERDGAVSFEREDGSAVELRGRIDLVLSAPEGAIIIDYKTGDPPAPGSIHGGAADFLPPAKAQAELQQEELLALIDQVPVESSSFQLPAYAMLVEGGDTPVIRMGYFSMKRSAKYFAGWYRDVLDLSGGDDPVVRRNLPIRSQPMLRRLEKQVRQAAFEWRDAVSGGDFRKAEGRCGRCVYRGLCRDGFAVRMGDEW
jgi:hypothetical protein